MYNQIAIGIDQSYSNTGISIIADGNIKDIKSIYLSKYSCNAARRQVLRAKLENLVPLLVNKSKHVVCMIERTRVHGGESSFINVNTIKAMASLTAITVDVMYLYGVNVYSVDTRSWKASVVGTSKPMPNKYGVPPEKWPTVKWVIDKGFENKILLDMTDSRIRKNTFVKDGRVYKYNDDAADSAGIGMFWFIGDHNKLKKEN